MVQRRMFRLRFASRRRGVAALAVLGVGVAVGGGAAVVSQSAWRIEQTSDGLTCGLQRTPFIAVGKVLEDAIATKVAACERLAKTTGADCPSISASALTECSSPPDVPPLPGLQRVLFYPTSGKPPIKEIGILELLKTNAHTILSSGGEGCPDLTQYAYLVPNSNCIGSKLRLSDGRLILVTAAHCLKKGSEGPKVMWHVSGAPAASAASSIDCVVPDMFDFDKYKNDCKNSPEAAICKSDIAYCALPQSVVDAVPAMDPYVDNAGPTKKHELQVMSRSGGVCSVKLDPLQTPVGQWPGTSDAFIIAYAKNNVQMLPADSGAPLFLNIPAKPRLLVGVNVWTSAPNEPMLGVALHLHHDPLLKKLKKLDAP